MFVVLHTQTHSLLFATGKVVFSKLREGSNHLLEKRMTAALLPQLLLHHRQAQKKNHHLIFEISNYVVHSLCEDFANGGKIFAN